MKITSMAVKILGLSKEEVAVLSILDTTSRKTSDVHQLLKGRIPRTTLLRILNSLHKRELIAKHKFSARRGGWIGCDITSIFQELSTEGSNHDDVSKVVVYRGKKEMLTLANKVLLFHEKERVYWIQPSKIWDAWRSAGMEERIVWLNNFLQERGIVADGITSDDFLMKDVEFGGEEILQGFLNRPMHVHTVPSKYLNFYSDVMIFRDVVSIMNWKDMFALEIKNRDLVNLFTGIIGYLHDTGKSVNVPEEAKKMLLSITKKKSRKVMS